MSKELRIQLEDDTHAAILAVAKARKVSPARIVTEAFMLHLDLAPRLREAIVALDEARADGDRIGAIADFIADLYRSESEAAAE